MKRVIYIIILLLFSFVFPTEAKAQIGDYRNNFAVGLNGGMAMSSVGFTPKVTQKTLQGYQAGISARYVCEKYFKTICSFCAELNYARMGWSENIIDIESQPVINSVTGENDKYDRCITYMQLPLLAHLAWGKEQNGMNFFIELGPQFGYMLNETTKTNFTIDTANMEDRVNKVSEQYSMPVENKFDYGICAGLGVELSQPRLGHFLLSGRYYYGLGNIYASTKRDYFAKSNIGAVEVKLTYLVDITK